MVALNGHAVGVPDGGRACPWSAGAPPAVISGSPTSPGCTPCKDSRCWRGAGGGRPARREHPRPAGADRRGGLDRPRGPADLAGPARAAAARPGRGDPGRAGHAGRVTGPRRSARSPRPPHHRPDDRVRPRWTRSCSSPSPSRSPRRSGPSVILAPGWSVTRRVVVAADRGAATAGLRPRGAAALSEVLPAVASPTLAGVAGLLGTPLGAAAGGRLHRLRPVRGPLDARRPRARCPRTGHGTLLVLRSCSAARDAGYLVVRAVRQRSAVGAVS